MSVPARSATVCRLSPADLMRTLADDTLRLAQQMDTPSRSIGESERRVHEAERIASAMRRLVRG
jgi:hypothetical protein